MIEQLRNHRWRLAVMAVIVVAVLVRVGADSVVGAGAVVSRPIPPRVVSAGVPAGVLRSR